jgi:xylulokinase
MIIFLGIDLGTTGLKAALVDEKGAILGTQYRSHQILSPRDGYAEQDPEDWWTGLGSACQALKREHPEAFARIAGVGICGQMHTQVYLDREHRALRPAITWMDQRAGGLVEEINNDREAKKLIFQESQNFASTTYTALHALWVKREQPEVWGKVSSILVAKDYIKLRLTGRLVTDISEASGTLLFNVKERCWSDALFRFFGFPRSFFPEVLPSDVLIGTVSAEASLFIGVKEGTPVANGCTDNSASALGAGMILPGEVTLIIGTAGVITVCSDKPLPDPANRTLCWNYCLPDRWVTLGIMQTAGQSLDWFQRAFDQTDSPKGSCPDIFEQYNRQAESVPEASGGLVFLPYLNGERTPYWDPCARGVFFGIGLTTEKAHFIRAVMEGVSMGLRQNIETVESLGIHIDKVRAVGGGCKSPVWLDILAGIIKKPVLTICVPDTGNLGNILLCGKAMGVYSSIEEASARMVLTGDSISRPEGSPAYEHQYALYLRLYKNLKGCFQDI